MATTPETKLQRAVQRWFIDRGFWTFKIHGSMYQKAGVPDLLLLKNGRAIFIETKTPSGRLSRLQVAVMKEIERVASVPCYVVRKLEECETIYSEAMGLDASSEPSL